MDMTEEYNFDDIVDVWREQMKKGYLKLSILHVLLNQPLHGYQIMKKIRELSLGLLSPTAGGLYPALRELEERGLIRGRWMFEGRRKIKIYEITDSGREVFKRAVEEHLNIFYALRAWVFKELSNLGLLDKAEPPPPVMLHMIKVLLCGNEPKVKKIEALKKLRESFKNLLDSVNKLILNIDRMIYELEHDASG